MKRIFLVLNLLLILLIGGCNSNEEDLGQVIVPTNSAIKNSMIRGFIGEVSPLFDWENNCQIADAKGNLYILPWYAGAIANLPQYIIDDYKKSEGWNLIYNFISDNNNDSGKYLIFYNVFTGTLRVFYYHNNGIGLTSTLFLTLSTKEPSNYLNHEGTFFFPSNEQKNMSISNINLSKSTSKGLNPGWNVFDFQIAYNPQNSDSNNTFSLHPMNVFNGYIDLTGNISLNSEGTIISVASTTNNNESSVYTSKTTFNNNHDKLDSNFNVEWESRIEKSNKVTLTTTQKKEVFSGILSLNGKLESALSSELLPIANLAFPSSKSALLANYIPSFEEPLGVWSLRKRPEVHITDFIVWRPEVNSYPNQEIIDRKFYCIGKREIETKFEPNDLIINPKVLDKIDSFDVEYELLYCPKVKGKTLPNGLELGNLNIVKGDTILSDNQTVFLKNPYFEIAPRYFELPEGCSSLQGFCPDHFVSYDYPYIESNFVFRITLRLIPKENYHLKSVILQGLFPSKIIIDRRYHKIKDDNKID